MPWGLGATYDDPFVTIQGQLSHRLTSDVNKDLTCKAKDMSFKDEDKVKDLIYKAKAKDLTFKAKDFSFKDKDKAKDLIYKATLLLEVGFES